MKRIITRTISTLSNRCAPFTVTNAQFRKTHRCWTWKAALEWMACYDAREFGPTTLTGYKGVLIARKMA